MSVLKEPMDVKNTVTITLEAIPATALDLVIDFTLMTPLVKVSQSLNLLSSNYAMM